MPQIMPSHSRQARRRGQALLVAVLLMMAILLVGILFVALVTYNQSQSERHEDMLVAQALAEAGIRYANQMLEKSADGADWRPPEPPAFDRSGASDPGMWGTDGVEGTEDDYYTDIEIQRGWAGLYDSASGSYVRRGFSRFPDPREPGLTNTPASGFTMGRGYFLLRVSYDPWGPGSGGTPDPMDWHLKIESIGRVHGSHVFRKLVAYKPIPMLDYARWVHNATGHGRPAQLGVPPYIDMDNDGAIPPGDATTPSVEWIPTTIRGPVRVEGTLQIAGAPHLDPGSGAIVEASTKFELEDRIAASGYLRDDTIEVTGGIEFLSDIDGTAEVTVIDAGGPTTALMYESDDPGFDTFGGRVRDGRPTVSGGYSRFASGITPPTLTLGEGTTNMDRYRNLTRDSGDFVEYPSGSGDFVNNGRWGFGAGIYIDNADDIQFDHSIQQLIDDWQRPNAAGGTPTTGSGWNALYTTYSPPAVKIEFVPDEAAMGSYETSANPADVGAGETWWPGHEAGQPGIKVTRYDKTWRAANGDDSGLRTRAFDYPTPWLDGTSDVPRHPLIVAEGNVRVLGRLPEAVRDASDTLRRAYDLVVVSGGTIYIDGQLLAPNDYLAAPVAPEFNTKLALLARDCVCLNATQIVPQLTTGTAPAVPDDPLNPSDREKHWELAPGSDGRAYSTFFWGGTPEGSGVALVAKQGAGDPGPSAVSLTTWVEGAGYSAYDFGDPPDPMVDTAFVFVPPAATFPDGSTPPQPYGVEGIAPDWAPYRDAGASLPWDLAGYVDPTPGLGNAIILRHTDPQLSAGSTSYWLKRWKVAEYNSDGLPVGAINARVNAAVYAERGCWYVLTASYFDDEASGDPNTPEPVEFRRYNYKISFNGTIAENFTAPVEAVQDWIDKSAYPAAYSGSTIDTLSRWGTIEYRFDETLRAARFYSTVADPMHPAANQPRVPLLPVSPDLVYYGEAQ